MSLPEEMLLARAIAFFKKLFQLVCFNLMSSLFPILLTVYYSFVRIL